MSRIFESGRLLLRQTHSRTCRGAIAFPSFQDLGKIQIFWAVTGKYLGKTNNFSGNDMKNLGKVRSFRAVTLNNCKRKFFFFFKRSPRFQNEISSSSENLRQLLYPISNVLKNHDLGKRHKIWAKLPPPNFFELVLLWSNRTIKREDFFTNHRDFGFEW